MKYDIIIPSWNQRDLTIQCLNSILKYSKDYRVIFVDNNSDPEVKFEIKNILKLMPNVLIENLENLGFVKAVNQGLLESTADYVVIMNNDTEAVPAWLEKLEYPFHIYENLGLSGPLTTSPNCWQGRYEPPDNYSFRLLGEKAMLAFFCVMIKKEVIKKVGLLDEDFGVGFCDDDDYCHRAKQAGYYLGLCQELTIPHHHRSTFKQRYSDAEIASMIKTARAKFKAKHGLK